MSRFGKKGLSLVLVFAFALSMLTGIIIIQPSAHAASASDYTALGVTYTATARADESIGLRASASIGTAVGISPTDTRLIRPNATMDARNSTALQVTVTPYARYALDKVVVAAIATITHPAPTGYASGTKEAVKDIQTFTTGSFSYAVPDFTSYVKSGDTIDVEIIVYADLHYTAATADYTIDLAAGTVSPAGSGITFANRTFSVNTSLATLQGKTIAITGRSVATGTGSNTKAYSVYVYNSTKNAGTRRVDLILDTATVYYTYGLTDANYHLYRGTPSTGDGVTMNYSTMGNSNRSSTLSGARGRSPLILTDVDAYMTVLNENRLVNGSSNQDTGGTNQCGINVDASASLIVTDASTGTLFTRGGGCSSAIGTGCLPAGFMEFDGGTVTAESASNSHCYAGIGNGGHYSSTDPGIRGVVINGGTVDAIGFHYGIGGVGGSSGTIDTNIGPQYAVITGGHVTTEGAAASCGSALGFSYNNERHEIRIGRPDKPSTGDTSTSVFSVNWGVGAAISGKMTFYSGTTEAYSGQYAAAIGGNANSAAAVSNIYTPGTTAATVIGGTPLTVYGGDVTAKAGAFSQGTHSDTSFDTIRGGGTRPSAQSVKSQPAPTSSYGAAIGGAVGRAGGAETKIFAGTFNVQSSIFGAGIGGGGGGYNTLLTASGAGGDTWIGNLYDKTTGTVAPMSFNVTSNIYGAGIGGGGSSAGAAGSGGNLCLSGGSFDIKSGTYGAGIGGGGAANGTGGSGGNVLIDGDTFGQVHVQSGLYGAGIGGGGTLSGAAGSGGNLLINCATDISKVARWNGASVTPSSYSFIIESGQFGAGIGGGGSRTGAAGSGAAQLTINGGNFGIHAGGSCLDASGVFNLSSPACDGVNPFSFGAGIGGGGSYSNIAGNGPANAVINGGYFNCFSEGYGAAIGGGGSYGSTGGTGGVARYTGGTVVVSVPVNPSNGESLWGSVGMGGGHSALGASSVKDGEVFIIGGNIATTIASEVNNDPTQHAWTLPNPKDNILSTWTTTTTAIKVEVPKAEIGKLVNEVEFKYHGASYFGYGTDGLYITEGQDKNGQTVGVAWIWVPSDLTLTYDLTSGLPAGSYGTTVSNGGTNDFNINYASRDAVGFTYVKMDNIQTVYNYTGDQMPLLEWNQLIETGESYVGATWGAVAASQTPPPVNFFAGTGNQLFKLVEHAPVDGYPVYLIGWAKNPIIESDHVTEHIFAKGEAGWDYTFYLIDEAKFSTDNITVYAMWGYDKNGNGVPDVREGGYKLSYNGNTLPGTPPVNGVLPINNNPYSTGEFAPLSTTIPTRPGRVFLAWTEVPVPDLDINTTSNIPTLLSTLPPLYIAGTAGGPGTGECTFTGTITGTTTFTGDNAVEFYAGNIALYALWADDSNGNGIPDFLEPPRYLIHDGSGAAGAPANKQYVDGNIGVSDTIASWTYGTNIFLGWTEDAGATTLLTRSHTAANLPADLANPITLAAPFNGSDKTVYAVWGEDLNNNGTPDYMEGNYRFIFDTKTPDTVNGVPEDPISYFENDYADISNNDMLTALTSGMDPYMKRTGWVLLGWLDYDLTGFPLPGFVNHDFTVASADAYSIVTGGYPDANLPFLHDVTTLQFGANDRHIYAVWGVDSNNNGVPDWYDQDFRFVQYVPSILNITPSSMPFYNPATPDIYIDRGPSPGSNFSGYTTDETVALSTIVPTAPGYVFLGWSPVYIGGTVFGINTHLDKTALFKLFALLEDIPLGANISTQNEVSYMGLSPITLPFGRVRYTLNSGLESNYASVSGITDAAFDAAYGGVNWFDYFSNNFSEMGFLESVTFDSFNANMDGVGGGPQSHIWTLYGIWAEDINQNGTPDIFENTYSLIYNKTGGSGGPANQNSMYLPGQTAPLDYSNPPGKLDINNNAMIFLGWTAESTVKQFYSSGDAAIVPTLASAVTFGNFDITVRAVWAEDLNQNGIPDVYENTTFTVTYNANVGIGAPTDPTQYQYGALVTVMGPGSMSLTNNTFIGWNTAANGSGTPYNPSDPLHNTFNITSDVTLYAQWDASGGYFDDYYTVTYNANGGSGAPVDPASPHLVGSIVTVMGPGSMTRSGYTFVNWNTVSGGGITYNPGDTFTITGDVILYAQWQASGGQDPVIPPPDTQYTLTFNTNGGTAVASITANSGTVIDLTKYTSIRNGYRFDGWYSDAALTTRVTSVTLTANTTVYAKWSVSILPDPFLPSPHYAYIIGYPDGTVGPNANVSRAEVATIFFRLLKDEVRSEYYTTSNSFSDVESAIWYNTAVSTLANMGIINGRSDGRFDGGAPITRAEFAAIAARFEEQEYTGPNQFTDTNGHWARELISRAANRGWILGYDDGTFKPDVNITRAQAVTLVNRVMQRQPESVSDLLTGMKTFTDNMDPDAWYYLAFQEATNSHEFVRKQDGLYEYWERLISDPDWQAYQ